MYKVEVDSRGKKTMELSNLKENNYSFFCDFFNEQNYKSESFKLRSEAGVRINWFDKKTNSLSIVVLNENYYDFENYVNKSLK